MPLDPAIATAYDSTRDMSRQPFRAACYAPFVSMVFDTIGRVRACCANYEYILGNLHEERLDAIWHGARIAALREALKNYDFSLGCGYCYWKIEGTADRKKTLADSSVVALKYEKLPLDANGDYWPTHLEFHLTNRCNLECLTCNGDFSHLIRARREKLPAYPVAFGEEFFEDLRKYLPRLKEAQFLGGEPFLMHEQHRVWDMLIEDRLAPMCHVTTNGTIWNEKVERVLDLLPVSVNVSMDGVTRETFERLRVNAKWDVVLENLEKFRAALAARRRLLGISFSLSRENVHEFVPMLLFAEERDAHVSVCNVFDPPAFSLYTLPLEEFDRILADVERAGEAARPKLTKNVPTLDHQLAELRSHAQRQRQQGYSLPYSVAQG